MFHAGIGSARQIGVSQNKHPRRGKENKMTTLSLNKELPSFHNKADKKVEINYEKWKDNPHYRKQINQGSIERNIRWMNPAILTPLDTQRDTKSKWCIERLEDMQGLDWTCFAPLSVSQDPNNDNAPFYVFDGCGRLLMAQMQDISEVPCYVYRITKEEAARRFAYTQDRGRRNLSKEIIFANMLAAKDSEALAEEQWLIKHKLYVQAAEDIKIGDVSGDLIKYRFVKLAKDNYSEAIIIQALDWIRKAWPDYGSVQQDMAMGLIHFLDKIPEAMKNGLNSAITEYFINLVPEAYSDPTKCKWKKDGGGVHNQEKESVAKGFYDHFQKSRYYSTSFNNVVRKYKFEPKG